MFTNRPTYVLNRRIAFLARWFDNPRIRAGALGMFALGDIFIEGASTANARLLITSDIQAGDRLCIRQLHSLTQVTRFSQQRTFVTNSKTERRYAGTKKKTSYTQDEIEEVRPERSSRLSGSSIRIEARHVQQSGAELTAGAGGVLVEAEQIQQIPAIATKVEAHSRKQCENNVVKKCGSMSLSQFLCAM